MAEVTGIELCHHTYNPWVGCAKVSPGCANCYAEVDTPARIARGGGVELWGPNAARKIKAVSGWLEPLRWDREAAKAGERRRVFCLSQGDFFEDRPDLAEPRSQTLRIINQTPNLDWLILTKRIELFEVALRRCLEVPDRGLAIGLMVTNWLDGSRVPPNLWLGVSVESRDFQGRIRGLLETPAHVRFLSLEPLLGGIYVRPWLHHGPGIDWVIVGGESGPNARPCNLNWIESIVEDCRDANVPVFVKQLGSQAVFRSRSDGDWFYTFPTKHKKGGDPAEWPEHLRVRQFPRVEVRP